MATEKVTALICSRNETDKTISLIHDLYDYVDGITLIDSSDREGRARLALEKKKKKLYKLDIYYVVPLGYPDPIRMYALKKCRYDWVLLIDTDERASKGLKENLRRFAGDRNIAAYSIKRYEMSREGGRYLEESYQTRLFRKNLVQYTGIRHEQPVVGGRLAIISDSNGSINHVAEIKGLTSVESGRMEAYDERLSYGVYNKLFVSYIGKFMLTSHDVAKTSIGRFFAGALEFYEKILSKGSEQELTDFDYLVYNFLRNFASGIKSKNIMTIIRSMPDAWHRLGTIRSWKHALDSEEAFGISTMINREGIIKFLSLDKESTIKKLNAKYKDKKGGIKLLIELLREEYRHRIGTRRTGAL